MLNVFVTCGSIKNLDDVTGGYKWILGGYIVVPVFMTAGVEWSCYN